jgi:rRNA maturation protein Rpf1
MKSFLEKTKKELIQKVKNNEYVPMTVYNLALDEADNTYQVFVHNFSLNEEFPVEKRLEVVKNCILGAEWESEQLGLKNICTLFGESFMKEGKSCLYIQIKKGEEELGEFHVFEQKDMKVNENGQLIIEEDIVSYVCDLKENINDSEK